MASNMASKHVSISRVEYGTQSVAKASGQEWYQQPMGSSLYTPAPNGLSRAQLLW